MFRVEPFYASPDLRKLPTPFYVYDLAGLCHRVNVLKQTLPSNAHIHFAMKSNNNLDILQVLHKQDLGVDLVSMGEMRRAHEAGFTSQQMIFSGVGKTVEEISFALEHDIHQINVESLPELERIADIAERSKKHARVALRMNPDIDVDTHPYIRTGFHENKFGFDFSEVARAAEILKSHADTLTLQGLTLHIGSQIRNLTAFREAIRKTLKLWQELKHQNFPLCSFDVGGGLGIDYLSGDLRKDEQLIVAYGEMLKVEVAPFVERIDLEPGRILIARFGALITEVQYVKCTPYKNFLIVDAGMNALLRPALYEAHHRIVRISTGDLSGDEPRERESSQIFDIVGPICESADVLGFERVMPAETKAGDRLAVLDVGAYGHVMSSGYNLRDPVKEYTLER